jgi:uncharacterized integral membrane protein
MSDQPVSLYRKVRMALAVVILFIVLVLILQNQDPVTTRILFWAVEMPRFILLGGVFLMGAAVGYLGGRAVGRR